MRMAKQLPLQKFQAIHIPLHASIAPRQRASRLHCGVISANPIGKTLKFGDLALFRLLEPSREKEKYELKVYYC